MVKIVGAGFGRTGTSSLREALKILGFPCYHMETVFERKHVDLWMEAQADPDNFDWERMFAGYEAVVDFPSVVYYKQIMKAYGPDTRVLLTVRDPEKWWESCMDTIFKVSNSGSITLELMYMSFQRMARLICWAKIFGGARFADKDETVRRYKAWVEDVKATVPPERLLVYEVQSGWEPLCRWLGKDIPDQPFPKINERKVIAGLVRMHYWMDVALYLALSIAIFIATHALGGIFFPDSTILIRTAIAAVLSALAILLFSTWAKTNLYDE